MTDRAARKRPRAPLPSPAEDAATAAAAESDPDNPPLTDEELAAALPAEEVMPEQVAEYRRTRGLQRSPTKPRGK